MTGILDNERLTRSAPGTPMGTLLRRYWQPVLRSWELKENDGPPVRVRILGEDLVAFRATDGRVGLIDAYCRHRRAPMFYGRNEQCGLRCVYHGWKFDVEERCVDLPNIAENERVRQNVRIKAYATVEKAGVIFAYMGPPERRPAQPDFEWMRAHDTRRNVTKTARPGSQIAACRWKGDGLS